MVRLKVRDDAAGQELLPSNRPTHVRTVWTAVRKVRTAGLTPRLPASRTMRSLRSLGSLLWRMRVYDPWGYGVTMSGVLPDIFQ